ncbi:putative holin-like toxin [Listeria monocytogenes]|uniref:putative holin-like toxin n=1 Tax=Listeria monocytogenes TaxID=1639 RepID=UPI0039C87856
MVVCQPSSSVLPIESRWCLCYFQALHGKDKRVTVFESLTLIIAFAVLIVTIMNSRNDKK